MQIKTTIFSCHTADTKPVKQEVISAMILPPLVFPAVAYHLILLECQYILVIYLVNLGGG
jgi:hypothetical protein